MAEKQAPQKQGFKKAVKHAAPEVETKEKNVLQKSLQQKKFTQPGIKKDLTDIHKDTPSTDEESSLLKDIMAISGQPGLFKFVSQARNGIIVESLDTGKRMQAFASMKVNSLKDIAVFTKGEEVLLEDVLKKIWEKQSGGTSIDPKSDPEELKSYFLTVLPDFDQERVYVSDIRKMISWYNILQKHDLLKFEEKDKTPVTEKSGEEKKDETAESNKALKAKKSKPKPKSESKS